MLYLYYKGYGEENMFKMLVVDDEYLVRTGIRQTIDWESYGVEIIGEATNGKQGLEMAIQLKPDVIISDIKMPVMDGLELFKAIKKTDIDCAAIILSGYKDFDYARKALESDVYSYLLKPIDNDELIKTVLVAIEKLKIQRENKQYRIELEGELPKIKNKVMLDIFLGNFDDPQVIEAKMNLYKITVIKQGFCIYGTLDEYNGTSSKEDYNALKELMNFIIAEGNNCSGELYSGFFALLIQADKTFDIEAYVKNAVKNFEQKCKKTVSIGISGYYCNLSEIKGAFHTAKNASTRKIFPSINTVTRADTDKNLSKTVQDALNYIANNYYKDIVIQMVADELYVSTSYIMHMFKNSIGKTFNECLTDYRMMIAKKLLLEDNYKIYEIAEAVGYSDVKYFSQVFKKNTSMTPSQYIMQEKGIPIGE